MKQFTLAQLKAIVAFIGAMLTTATLLDWGVELPAYVTALASLLTAAAVYAVPNIQIEEERAEYQPRRALQDATGGDLSHSDA